MGKGLAAPEQGPEFNPQHRYRSQMWQKSCNARAVEAEMKGLLKLVSQISVLRGRDLRSLSQQIKGRVIEEET